MNKLAIQSFGSLINVEGDGNCGYHAVKELLVQQNIISNKIKISEIRKELFDSAVKTNFLLEKHQVLNLMSKFKKSAMKKWILMVLWLINHIGLLLILCFL